MNKTIIILFITTLFSTSQAKAGLWDWIAGYIPGLAPQTSSIPSDAAPNGSGTNSCTQYLEAKETSFLTSVLNRFSMTSKISLPTLTEPTKLERGTTRFYMPTGYDALLMMYKEYLTPERSDKDYAFWYSKPHGDSGYANQTGLDVILARTFEAFGYQTSQPRIADVFGKKVVLSMSLDGRLHGDQRITTAFDIHFKPLSNAEFRKIRLLMIFLNIPYLDGVFKAGETIFLSSFDTLLADTMTSSTDFDDIADDVSTNWLSPSHPWRSGILNSDVEEFKATLVEFNESWIRKIVKMGELGDRNIEDKIIKNLIQRRNLLLSSWSAEDLPGQPSVELLEALARIPKELEKLDLLSNDDKLKLLSLSINHVQDFETILTAYISGESTNSRTFGLAFDNLRELARNGMYNFSDETTINILDKTLIYLSDSNLRYEQRTSFQHLFRSLFFEIYYYNDWPSSLLEKVSQLLVNYYFNNPTVLAIAFETKWHFPDTDMHSPVHSTYENYFLRFNFRGATQASEVLLLSIVSSAIKHAKTYDGQLGRGMGFHNALRVNSGMEHAREALSIFKKLNIPRSQITQNLDFDKLILIFDSLIYDSLGRRRIGLSITPEQVFNIDGATRKEPYNIYDLLNSYIVGQLEGLPGNLISN